MIFISAALGGFGTTANAAQTGLTTATDTTAKNAQLQQQILLLANDPYGDLPIFKNLKQVRKPFKIDKHLQKPFKIDKQLQNFRRILNMNIYKDKIENRFKIVCGS